MKEKRIFTSIDLAPETRDYLRSLRRSDIYTIKWMNPDNLHITLNFLGELEARELEKAAEIMERLSAHYAPFEIHFTKAAAVRDMLWIEPKHSEDLVYLQRELKNEFKAAGIGKSERRAFSPHILLAKSVKSGRNMRLDKIKNFKLNPFVIEVKAINLYQSELTPGNATHTLIQEFPLA